MDFILVGLGGLIGSICRYGISLAERSLIQSVVPGTTLFVNLIGCFMAGILISVMERVAPVMSKQILYFGSIGFLGSFTTFSALSTETLLMLKNGQKALAIVNVVTQIVSGVLAVYLGQKMVR